MNHRIRSTRLFLVAALGLLATQAGAATAVAPGSGHPEGSHPWASNNANANNTFVIDNRVCGGSGTFVWITPLAVPTSPTNRVTFITQDKSGHPAVSRSEGWSFFPNGSVFSGIAQQSTTVVGNLTVPPGGTAFVKTILSFDVDVGGSCINTITFN